MHRPEPFHIIIYTCAESSCVNPIRHDMARLMCVLLVMSGVCSHSTDGSGTRSHALKDIGAVPCNANLSVGVLVYGGTAGGVVAAVAAARMLHANMRLPSASTPPWHIPVLLVNPAAHLGGMVSSGLGWTDGTDSGGIAREFFQAAGGYHFAPSTAARVFSDLVANASVVVASSCAVASVRKSRKATGADAILPPTMQTTQMQQQANAPAHGRGHIHPVPPAANPTASIASIRTAAGGEFAATAFIDSSYEGDLMALAGVGFTVGRESAETYSEAAAGRLPVPPAWACGCNWAFGTAPLSPYVSPFERSFSVLQGSFSYQVCSST